MFCKNCGGKIEEGSKFCGNCGTAVEAAADMPAPAPAGEAAAGPAPAPVEEIANEPVAAPAENPVTEPAAVVAEAPATEPVAASTETSAPESTVVVGETPASEPAVAPTQVAAPEKKPLSKELLIGIIVGAVLLIALLVVLLIPKGGNNGDNGGGSSNNNGGSSNTDPNQRDAGLFTVSVPEGLRFSYEVDDEGDEDLNFHLEDDDDLYFYLLINLYDKSEYSDDEIESLNKYVIERYSATTNTIQGVKLIMWNEDNDYDEKIINAIYVPGNKWEYDVFLKVNGDSESYTEGLETTLFEKYVPAILKSIKKK